jgi:hypothetical protein
MVSAESSSKPNDLYSYVIPFFIEDKVQTFVDETPGLIGASPK